MNNLWYKKYIKKMRKNNPYLTLLYQCFPLESSIGLRALVDLKTERPSRN
jgi:hypothetical protein